jgi:hypothetical protein
MTGIELGTGARIAGRLQKERKRSGGCALEIGLYLKEHPFPLLLHPPPARSATGIRGWKTGIRGWITGIRGWITGIRATGKRNKGMENRNKGMDNRNKGYG